MEKHLSTVHNMIVVHHFVIHRPVGPTFLLIKICEPIICILSDLQCKDEGKQKIMWKKSIQPIIKEYIKRRQNHHHHHKIVCVLCCCVSNFFFFSSSCYYDCKTSIIYFWDEHACMQSIYINFLLSWQPTTMNYTAREIADCCFVLFILDYIKR